MADFPEPIPVERLQRGPLSSSLMDSSSCDPGGSAAGRLMDSARRCSYGLPGASWALASVDGALLQQVVALRLGGAWDRTRPPGVVRHGGSITSPTRRAFARASCGPGNSCLCRGFLCSDACPLPLLSLSLRTAAPAGWPGIRFVSGETPQKLSALGLPLFSWKHREVQRVQVPQVLPWCEAFLDKETLKYHV